MSTEPLVDAAVLAAHLGMAISSIYRLHAKGLISAYACGPLLRGRRFDIAEVRSELKALAQKTVKA